MQGYSVLGCGLMLRGVCARDEWYRGVRMYDVTLWLNVLSLPALTLARSKAQYCGEVLCWVIHSDPSLRFPPPVCRALECGPRVKPGNRAVGRGGAEGPREGRKAGNEQLTQ
jgi:hypothetical protein